VVEVIYEPRDDSELLLSVVEKIVKPDTRVLDMGTGTGVVAIAAAKKGVRVVGVDINPKAVEVAEMNAGKAGVEVEFRVSDLFQNVDGKFDLIIFNPPYLPEDEREDSESRINTTDSGTISQFLKEADKYLEPDGFILILISSLTPTRVDGEIVGERKIPWETLSVIKVKK
jgi:release factor glutamine methyltransferase